MKYILSLSFIFCTFLGMTQSDMTMYFSTNINPLFPNQIEIKLHSTVAYPVGSSITFEVGLPPLTTINTFTAVLPGVSLQGTNTYGSVAGLPAIAANGEIVLGRFTWSSTASPGVTGDFTILNNGNNYIEYGDPALERQTAPVNNALNVILPIDIKTFSATKDGDRNARLDWSTSLEINSAYFGIERSTDGNTWEGISKVAAAGNSNTEQFYAYTDRDLPLNRNKDQIFYYRLQLVDLDGQYKYSDIRGVNFGKADSDKIISLYPNPAVQMVNLDLSGMDLESGDIHLRVSDMQGRNMIDKPIYGNGIEPVDVTQLPAGTYNVAITQGQNLYQKQFIKID